jgi:hypothetical protein
LARNRRFLAVKLLVFEPREETNDDGNELRGRSTEERNILIEIALLEECPVGEILLRGAVHRVLIDVPRDVS